MSIATVAAGTRSAAKRARVGVFLVQASSLVVVTLCGRAGLGRSPRVPAYKRGCLETLKGAEIEVPEWTFALEDLQACAVSCARLTEPASLC